METAKFSFAVMSVTLLFLGQNSIPGIFGLILNLFLYVVWLVSAINWLNEIAKKDNP